MSIFFCEGCQRQVDTDLCPMGDDGCCENCQPADRTPDPAVAELVEALEKIASEAEAPQRFYNNHGPQWTTPAGTEYEDTSDHLNVCNGIAELARAALAKHRGK